MRAVADHRGGAAAKCRVCEPDRVASRRAEPDLVYISCALCCGPFCPEVHRDDNGAIGRSGASDMAAEPPQPGQAVRLGGMVEQGSLRTQPDGVTVEFVVGDGEARVPVIYSGIVPDLFVEGSGVVAEGSLRPNGTFVATNLLAKHDENYMPRELEDMNAAQKREVVAETE